MRSAADLTNPQGRRRFPSHLLIVAIAFCAHAAAAQVPFLDPLPWTDPDRPPDKELMLQFDRFEDEKTHWLAHRVGLTGRFAAGERSAFFVRLHYLAFDTSDQPVLERWPWLAGEDVTPGWPFEQRSVGFTRPEVGLIAPLGLPLLGRSQLALALAVPVGREELYPMSAASMPLRFGLRRPFALGGDWTLSLTAAGIVHFDSGREDLLPEAFPGGRHLSGELAWRPGGRPRLAIDLADESLDGIHAARASLQIWLPIPEGHDLGLRVERDLAGRIDRPYATWAAVTWRIVIPEGDDEDASSRD